MFHCRHWEAVIAVTAQVHPDPRHEGYYSVTVRHVHAVTATAVVDEYHALTWGETTSVVESALEASRPGYRHAPLQALQERLWPD